MERDDGAPSAPPRRVYRVPIYDAPCTLTALIVDAITYIRTRLDTPRRALSSSKRKKKARERGVSTPGVAINVERVKWENKI